MAIPVYLWLKDDGGADIKGAEGVQDREGSIEVVAQKHNHIEQKEQRYEKITWTYKDGNIIHSDSWNERATA
ncbi:hypothetical protein [Mangrovibacter phragmitis]|nr:hypothetical protein [Mangrovibacter phragmitis]